ncbi:MAG: UDP-N-acetylmuramoyl-tripeptide--D-alanyl-D-alanine ligase [Fimbriimonadaceae bacterium]|nr:UDP-N-acetylmuramoyl-tripeptide--D-alanyl-D-alanine ligase [Fimbriimonadaceae bacterium]
MRGFATDSRAVEPGQAFLAFRGGRTDGADHVPQALAAGAALSVVERPVPGPHILVDSVVEAIARMGRTLRAEFRGPVVGITGSNGKTTTKEMTAAALAPLGPVLKSQGNRNSEFSSPLVWAEEEPPHASAVVEMGMRGFGQIAHLASIARPTIGIVTMIGTAHIEMVGSRAGIAQAKGELLEALPADGTAVLWREDDFFADLCALCPCPVVTFGTSPDADLRIFGIECRADQSTFVAGNWKDQEFSFSLPGWGGHLARNAAAALAAAVSAGVEFGPAIESLERGQLPPLRMEIRSWNGVHCILDFYNASPDSTVSALQTVARLPHSSRLAVLGDMRELGDHSAEGHRLVGRSIAEANLDRVLLVGPQMAHAAEEAIRAGFPVHRLVHSETVDHDTIRNFVQSVQEGGLILIKGSRALELERGLPEELQ